MEEFSIRTIRKSYKSFYCDYIWHDKEDDFDFTSPDDKIALEVVTILSKNEINAIQYEKALDSNKSPDISRVINSHADNEGELLYYHGGTMSEIKDAVIEAILKKEEKRKKRTKKYNCYELCICINEGGLFNRCCDFKFIFKTLKTTKFSRVFIITCLNFFVVENNQIEEYKRVC